jgi:hypothetical protein
MTQHVSLGGLSGSTFSVVFDKFDVGLGSLTEVRMAYGLLSVSMFVVGNPNNLQTPDTFFELASSVEFGLYLAGPLLGRGAAVFLPDFNGPFRFSENGLGFGYVQVTVRWF